jgi:O-antigen/teichoic acid export membrane protein
VFGQMNWSLAVLLLVFGVLTFGIDQILVRKIAAGYNRSSLFSTYFFHVLISGILFYVLLLIYYLVFPVYLSKQTFLLSFGIGKLAIFISTPFKQMAAGMEKFGSLFLMSVISNIIRGTLLVVLLALHMMTIHLVVIVFIAGDLTELGVCILMIGRLIQFPFQLRWNKRRHIQLIRESLPQTGTIIFTAIMSRFDWILVGLLISDAKLAEYSFAYKLFEVSTLPLLIIAPIMIPLFTRLHNKPENFRVQQWPI